MTARLSPGGASQGVSTESRDRLPTLALAPLLALAAAVAVVLIAFAARYGYHGDELYFLAAGHHLAWGYPDLPPLVPLLARALSDLAPGSLVVLRAPSALAAAGVVILTGLTCRELGGGRAAQVLAAAVMAISPLLLASAHLFGTEPFDLLFWTLLVFLVARILRTGDERLWLVVGAVAGIGLLNKDLVAFLALGAVGGLAIAGPRRMLASPWLWAGALIAGLLWAPYLVWQAQHGWPQLAVARSIAAGHSGTSEPRWAFLPYQLLLISPYLAPVWIAGLVRLFRDPALRFCRALAWSWVVLAAVFIVTGGKPYYLGGLMPLLLAAGAAPTIAWLSRRRARLRRGALIAGLALTAATSLVITLPVVPVGDLHRTNVVALNYDAGATVGWPTYVGEMVSVYRGLSPQQRASVALLTSSYAEAGAVDRFGAALGLPQAQSGHDGFWYWGPPPAAATTFIAVGFDRGFLEQIFASVRLATRLNNHLGVNNDDQGAPVWVCSQPRAGWSLLWPKFRYLG
jgi:4-amino-4-deoxy-L-arabinose transferase-like glycosyltransferase